MEVVGEVELPVVPAAAAVVAIVISFCSAVVLVFA
jgi:hypothetical protein